MRSSKWFVFVAVWLVAAPLAMAQTITIVPSLGPSGYGSSWASYRDNAIAALRGFPVNNVGGPSDYMALEPLSVEPTDMLMTSPVQHSWMGDFAPEGVFANEYGNKLYFGVALVAAEGSKVKLSDVVCRLWSTDELPAFWDATYSFSTYSYTTARVGVRAGGDGLLGTGDDVLITSGVGTQEVDAIYMTGVSPSFTLDNYESAQSQATFLLGIDYGLGSLTGDDAETSSVSVVQAPEPTAIGLLLVGTLIFLKRR